MLIFVDNESRVNDIYYIILYEHFFNNLLILTTTTSFVSAFGEA
jgi:hypothetical protein